MYDLECILDVYKLLGHTLQRLKYSVIHGKILYTDVMVAAPRAPTC